MTGCALWYADPECVRGGIGESAPPDKPAMHCAILWIHQPKARGRASATEDVPLSKLPVERAVARIPSDNAYANVTINVADQKVECNGDAWH